MDISGKASITNANAINAASDRQAPAISQWYAASNPPTATNTNAMPAHSRKSAGGFECGVNISPASSTRNPPTIAPAIPIAMRSCSNPPSRADMNMLAR